MNILLTPLVIVGIFTLISYFLYWLGGKMAPATEQSEDKLMAYASGEKIPGQRVQQSYSLFHVAFIFTVFHVAVLLLAMIPDTGDAFYALVFLGGLAAAAFALVTGGDADE